ncbi:MAG: gluconokinase [Pseudobacter sp.]|uniref:gluconokinase n=1 Tax=Pseudobacter sp. TaxID=2045420 RepID=UPI003F81FA2F
MTSNKKCIITIEIGTNAVRVVAFDLSGKTIASMKGSYPTFHAQPDFSEQDPEQIFITLLYVLKNLLNEHIHPEKIQVTSICFSASMHSVLPINKSGTPLGNAITWADNRARKEVALLKGSSDGNQIYMATGTPMHPMSPLFKIAWLKNNDKERFSNTSKFIQLKTYIIHQLTGEYLIDYSLASATGLLNIHTIKWEEAALSYAGINKSMLADPVPVFTSCGKLKKAYQNSLGLTAATQLIVGSSDGCLATLGAGVWDGNKATITIEDSGAVRVIGKKVLNDTQQRFFNYLLTENCYVSGGPTNSGGIIFEWFAKQFGDFKYAYDLEHTMKDLIAIATKVEAGADGLLFLPYLLGERAPIWDANARGVYFGINIKHERKHFIRAVIEGILFEIYSIGKILEEHSTIKSLSINGSFASIPLCAQIIADMFNKPVSISQHNYSVGAGAYLLSATEMGIFKSLDEAARSIELTEEYFPKKNINGIYRKHFEIFEMLSTKLKPDFENVVNLQ